MAASTSDKIDQVTSSATGRPVTASLSAPGHTIAGTTITINSATNWSTTTGIHFSIYATTTVGSLTVKDTTTQTDWKGTLSGTTISNMTITGGTDQDYSAGAIVEITPTARYAKDLYDWAMTEHTVSGTHAAVTGTTAVFSGAVTAASFTQTGGAAETTGWTTGLGAPDTITANGNRSYDVVYNSTDKTSIVSNGMRLKLTRTVTAPTQCTSLNGSTQYWEKTTPSAMTWTDDFAVGRWVYLTSYPGTAATIDSRYNGTSGWYLDINSSGQARLIGANAGAANISYIQSYQSVPLNKWVFVSAQLDMSAFTATTTTSYVMLDGLDIPAQVLRAGTNPTALIQAGNYQIGASNATNFFPGRLGPGGPYSAKVTQATFRTIMSQALSGSETSISAAINFNGNATDASANTNTPTAVASATATNANSPFGGQADGTTAGTTEYAIITKTAFSTNTTLTVQVPEGNAIPTSGGVSAVSYSTQASPYGYRAVSPILGYAQNNTDFAGTTNGGNGDNVLGLTTTVTVPEGKQIRFIVTGKSVKSSGAAGGTTSVRVVEGTTELAGFTAQIPVAGYNTNPNFTSIPFTPTTGAHTYQVNIVQSGAGTQTFAATTTAQASLSVEVIGGL